jgi:hypothetical protein
MKSGPQMVIDYMTLFGILGDDAFYDALPAGMEDLRAKGKHLYKAVVDLALGKAAIDAACSGCSQHRQIITPFQSVLGQRLAMAKDADPKLLEPLADYIGKRRSFRPLPIMMYYLDGLGRTSRLMF